MEYIRHNYAKVPDTGAWMNAQTENWGKFIDKNMNNGKVNQELWAASVRIIPQGNGYNWNVLTVDAFESLKDMLANGGEDYPDMSSINFEEIILQCLMVGIKQLFGKEFFGLTQKEI